jgi:molybdopterin molybdotransferase
MVVFDVLVKPFIQSIAGRRASEGETLGISAILTRNVPSAQGREEVVRVRLVREGEDILAEPLLGKSGLINTMVHADGVFRIPLNMEGMEKGCRVRVTPV